MARKRGKKKKGRRRASEPFEVKEMDQESMDDFIAEIATHIKQKGMVTIGSATYPPQTWDITRIKKEGEYTLYGLRFGIDPMQTPLFLARLWNILMTDRLASVILRSFTEKKDKITGLPVKELRGYFVWLDDADKVCFHQISAKEMQECNTVDAMTGRQLGNEPSVIYRGPDTDDFILSL